MQLTMCNLNKTQNKDGLNIKHSKYLCHSELYEKEIRQVFTYLNNLMTKLSIEKDELKNSSM